MSIRRKLLPVAAFGLSLAATIFVRRAHPPAPGAEAAKAAGVPQARTTKTPRAEDTATAVRALLRDGKLAAARELLGQLATRDPAAFFKLLSRLPGLPGMEDIIREAAAKLPWNQQPVIELLNAIPTKEWSVVAWQSYIAARVGVLPDQEVYDVGNKAGDRAFCHSLLALFKDAAEKRPEAMLAIINRDGDMGINMLFFSELMKSRPERASELFRSIPDGSPGSAYSKAYILQVRARALPTAENLQAVLTERGGRGVYETSSGRFLVSSVYPLATQEEKARVLEFIASQPPIARNRLLDGIAFTTLFDYNDPIAPEEFSRILGTYTSGEMQEKALDTWLKRNQDLVSRDSGWIDLLPTERLKDHARERMEKQEGESGP